MRAIQPVSWAKSNEKLTSICVGTCISHAEEPFLVVADVKVLVREFSAVDRETARSIVVSKISSLRHEVLYHSVEGAALVSVFILVITRAQRSEVLSCFWHVVCIELNLS